MPLYRHRYENHCQARAAVARCPRSRLSRLSGHVVGTTQHMHTCVLLVATSACPNQMKRDVVMPRISRREIKLFRSIPCHDHNGFASFFATHQMPEQSGAWKAAKPFVNGGLSGMCATSIIQPIDMVKVRLQLGATGTPVRNPLQVCKAWISRWILQTRADESDCSNRS